MNEMLNSISKNSIGELVMNHFQISMVDRFAWWLTYKESVHRAVKEARNGKAQEIKRVFIGNYFMDGLPNNCISCLMTHILCTVWYRKMYSSATEQWIPHSSSP